MPEGPEIRLAADKVARVLVDNRVETVGFGLPQLKRFEKRLRGNVVTAVETRGKAMLTRFDNGLTIYSHNQLLTHPFLSRVGPDILDRELTRPHIVQRLCNPAFRNRSLGSLYLDQRFLAGNGNYLRSEILWAAGLDPTQKPGGLAAAELETLATETLRLARRSHRTRGVTVAAAAHQLNGMRWAADTCSCVRSARPASAHL